MSPGVGDALAFALVVLHMVDGRAVLINPDQVTQLMEPRASGGQLVDDVNCVVRLTDGTYVSVVETCDEVRRLIEGR